MKHQKRNNVTRFLAAAVLLATVVVPGIRVKAQAATVQLAAVPWFGNEALEHQVFSGGQVILQAVAWLPGSPGIAVPLSGGTWDPGDGTGPVAITVSNSLALERAHTYTGSVGLVRIATIDVWDVSGTHYTDTMNVVIAPNSRETKVNMAIDKGLWNLHKKINRTTSDSKPSGYWQSGINAPGYFEGATAGVVQAFEINNHRESGDVTKNPYVDDVARGLRYILSQQHGRLNAMNMSLQGGNQPDSNLNGIGLGTRHNTTGGTGDHSVYMSGQIIDALVASGTPTKTAETGNVTYVAGRSYKDIVQDMLDGYSWGMLDSVGGWHYIYNQSGGQNDTSASHWWAIGMLAANTWNLDSPAWVKNLNKNTGIPLMQAPVGHNAQGCYFGYTGNYNSVWGDTQTNVTAAGLILMNANGMLKTDARYTCGMTWLNTHWTSSMGNLYTMYQFAKAARTAKADPGTGVTTSPITMIGTHDWYAEYADHLIANQNAAGEFHSTNTSQVGMNRIGPWIGHPTNGSRDLSSSWAIIILSPSLFDIPPVAKCVASPPEIGSLGGIVGFTSAGTFHPDPNASITNYSWNFGDGSPLGSGASTSHNFATPPSFPTTRNVVLTVTDNKGIAATASCPVKIVDTNVAPSASHGGPYAMCAGGQVILNGSGSTDEDGTIVSYKWSWGTIDFNNPKATGSTVNVSAAFNALGPGTYNLGLQVTDNEGKTGEKFTTVIVRAANDPLCNQPPSISQADITAEATGPNGATVSFTPTVSDPNAGDILTSSCVPPSGSVFPVGPTPVTCTVSDGKGGSASTMFNVKVTKAPTITVISCSDVVYTGAAQQTCTATVSDTHGFSQSVTVDYAGDTTNVGIVSAAATFAGDSWHTLSTKSTNYNITPATPVATATGGMFTYNGLPQTGTCSVVGVGGEPLSGMVGYSSGSTPVDAGSYTVTCSYAATQNYTATNATASLLVNPAPVTAKAGSGDNVYDGAPHAPTACTVSGVYFGDLSCANNPATAGPNVSVTSTSPIVSGSGLGNYAITPIDGSYAITPAAPVATATGGTFTYNGAAHFGTCSVEGAGGSPLAGAVSYSSGSAPVDAGSYTVTCSYEATQNYAAASATASLTIEKAAVTATAGNGGNVYDGATHTPSACVVSGPYKGDLACTNSPATAGPNVSTTPTTAVVTGTGLSNYAITPVNGSYAITQAPSSTVVTCPTSQVYTSSAITPCTATVTGAGGFSQPVVVTYSTNINVGTAGASATYEGGVNHTGSSGPGSFQITPAPTTTTLTSSPSPQLAGQPVTLTATVSSVASGVPVGEVTFTEGLTVLGTATVNGSGVAVLTTTLAVGPHTINASYSGNHNYIASAATTPASQLIYALATGGGTFVIGNNNATLGNTVNFWGSQWEKNNSMTGGASNASFKGFAISPAVPTVGATFTSAPGNSAPPPAGVPTYMGIIVTSRVTKSGSNITGTIVGMVVVRVDPGYQGNPGHAGTGTIVAILP